MTWRGSELPPDEQIVVDNHAHLFKTEHMPPEFWSYTAKFQFEQAKVRGEAPANEKEIKNDIIEFWNELTIDKFIEQMDRTNVNRTIMFPVDFALANGFSEPEMSIREVNQHYAEIQRDHPDRITTYATVDPRREEAPEIIIEALDDLGMSGVKLHPTAGYFLHDKEAYEILDIANSRDVPVLTDAKAIRAPLKSRYIHPINIDDVISDFPDLTFVAAHAGLEWWEDMLVIARNNLNTGLHIDLSGWQNLARDEPLEFCARLSEFIEEIGANRIHWGTDTPAEKAEWLSFIWSLQEQTVGEVEFERDDIGLIVGDGANPLIHSS